jgi:hypothetical protein
MSKSARDQLYWLEDAAHAFEEALEEFLREWPDIGREDAEEFGTEAARLTVETRLRELRAASDDGFGCFGA